jgi:hypothetical protein
MCIVNSVVKEAWQSIEAMGVFDENTPIDYQVFEAIMQDNSEEVKTLLLKCEDSAFISNLTLSDLLKLPFNSAKKAISDFSMAKRITMLNQLEEYKTHIYIQADRYGQEGLTKDEMISAKEFRSLIGKIKHMEIVQNWLYGLD